MAWHYFISLPLLVIGVTFFIAGSIGLIRFPSFACRLHALTKADNLGLGCVALAIAIQQESWAVALKIMLCWLIVLICSSLLSFLIARRFNVELTQGPAENQP